MYTHSYNTNHHVHIFLSYEYIIMYTYLIAVHLSVGGNRTHVTIPKDILTTIALYHSAIEVLIEFDNEMYAYSYNTSITGICVHLV